MASGVIWTQASHLEKSISTNGITFTINNYKQQENKLFIYYTVTSKKKISSPKTVGSNFMDRPHFYINDKHLNVSFIEDQTKVDEHKFTGYVAIDLDDIKEKHYKFTFLTDKIANQTGKWKLSFDIKKETPDKGVSFF